MDNELEPTGRAARKKIEFVQSILQSILILSENMEEAALIGDLEAMKIMHTSKTGLQYDWNMQVFINATLSGNLEAIKWLNNAGCPQNTTIDICINNDDEDDSIMKYLYELGYPIDESTIETSLIYGDLHTMKWLWSKHCPYDDNLLVHALILGDLEIIAWLLPRI